MSHPQAPAGRRLDLGAGRHLAWSEYGDPSGLPVLYCHGFPGSRLEARLAEPVAGRLGLRLIAPDRPGIGGSDPHPGRRLLDWPDDLARLGDHLRLARFHLVGISGGGPYALAAAYRLGSRLAGVAVVCGLGPLDVPGATRGMGGWEAFTIRLFRAMPRLAGSVYGRTAALLFSHRPEWVLRLLSTHSTGPDREVLSRSEVREVLLPSIRAAFRQGHAGPAQELGLYIRPWGWKLEETPIEVQLWHGEEDITVPVSMGRGVAARLPRCHARFLPEEAHFSLVVRHTEAILAKLVSHHA